MFFLIFNLVLIFCVFFFFLKGLITVSNRSDGSAEKGGKGLDFHGNAWHCIPRESNENLRESSMSISI